MPSLFVRVVDPQNQPLNSVSASWRLLQEDSSHAGIPEQENHRTRLDNVPATGEFLVNLVRPHAPVLEVSLDLTFRGDRRFTRGRPTVMRFSQQGGERRQSRSNPVHELVVTWHEPQEVIICAGADTRQHRRSHFLNISMRRFARMVQRHQINPSCVLTLFEFNDAPSALPSRIHRLLPGQGTRDVPSRSGKGRAVLMSSSTPRSLSITNVYDYLARVGQERQGTVMSLEFPGHGYWIGPVLGNTARPSDFCNEHCPTHVRHSFRHFSMPSSMPYPHYGIKKGADSRQTALIEDWRTIVLIDLTQSSRSRTHSRDTRDRDPRNTDFCLGIMPDDELANIRGAFHQDASIRVWGCSNGDMGPRWRAVARERLHTGSENTLLTVRSEYHPRAVNPQTHRVVESRIPQAWKVRRGDLALLYLSQARRCYAQAIATALQRPCFAAVPGTWSNYVATDRLGGMKVDSGTINRMRTFARQLLGFTSEDEDEAGYYRFVPNPSKHRVTVKVLVIGFVSFGRERTNASSEAVKLFPNIFNTIERPPWIDLDLHLEKEPEVDTVWTCQAPLLPPSQLRSRSNRPVVRGGLGILQKTQQMDASIVVMVGESKNLNNAPRRGGGRGMDMRIEQFAQNFGSGNIEDNDGNRLRQSGPIFPGQPNLLESIVSRYTWASMVHTLTDAGFHILIPNGQRMRNGQIMTMQNSAGAFICNESFYHLLLESQLGHPTQQRSHPTGRWVSLVHVAAYRDERSFARLAHGLGLVVRTLIEDVIWATEIYGLQVP